MQISLGKKSGTSECFHNSFEMDPKELIFPMYSLTCYFFSLIWNDAVTRVDKDPKQEISVCLASVIGAIFHGVVTHGSRSAIRQSHLTP